MWSVAGAFVFGSWYGEWRVQRDAAWDRAPLLSTAIDSVRANFLDSLPEDVLIRRAVQGMLHELGDPYAALLDGEGAATYRGTLQGEGQGLGLTVRLRADGALVRRVAAGSPAALAGVRAGDLLLTMDDRPATDAWAPTPLANDSPATAPRDTVRLLAVRASGRDTLAFAVARRAWQRPAVEAALRLEDGSGYVRLASLARGAGAELEQAVATLRERGVSRLVLDLRGNSGGLYEEGVRAAELFLERGQLVASLERRGERGLDPQIARRSRWPDLPVVLLVDRHTASAAELLAAALRDHARALLVGEATYGKAHVQRIVPLRGDLALRLTTARWLPPSREPVERRTEVNGRVAGGLTPDVRLPAPARLDPSAVPLALSPAEARRVSEAADAVLTRALRDGWAGAPAPLLERRARAHVDSLLPRDAWSEAQRRALLGDAVRVAVRRLLEVTRTDEALWQYAAFDDVALRTALSMVAPPIDRDTIRGVATRVAEERMMGDSLGLRRLDRWTLRRFPLRRLDSVALVSPPARGVAISSPIVLEGRLAAAPDTLVALHWGASDAVPLVVGRTAWLSEPAGATTPLAVQVVARTPFRTPRVVNADSARLDDWQIGWVYLVVAPPKVAAAHPAGFAGWRLVAEPARRSSTGE
jgi:carboxyl-terminal processing protease